MKQDYLKRGIFLTLGAVIVLVGCLFLWNIRSILFLIFISLLVASGIRPVVNWLRKGPLNRSFAILIVYTFIFGIIALILYLSLPPLIGEARNLVENFSSQQSTEEVINNINNPVLQNAALWIYQNIGDLTQQFIEFNQALNLGLSIFGGVFAGLTVFVVTYYWLTEREKVYYLIVSFVPPRNQAKAKEVWDGIEAKLGAWVRGELVMMLFIGTLAGLGYVVIGVKFAFALAVFAGLTELIPLVGPYIGGIPAVLVALTEGWLPAVLVVVYLVLLQLIEGNVLVPRVMEKAVGVNPLAVIVGLLIGGTLAGIAGALIAVPVVAVIQVIYRELVEPITPGATQSSNDSNAYTRPAKPSLPNPASEG